MVEVFVGMFGGLLTLMGAAAALAAAGLAACWRSLKAIQVPEDAGFFATMHYVPVQLVVLLDLLDFGLDIFAAPVSWIVLDQLGLKSLRNKAAVEALIPFTQPIPTFTLSWLAARLLNLGDEHIAQLAVPPPAEPPRRHLPR